MYLPSFALGFFVGFAHFYYKERCNDPRVGSKDVNAFIALLAPWPGFAFGTISMLTAVPYIHYTRHVLPPISIPFLATATAYTGCYLFYHGHRKYQEYKR